MDAWTLVAQVGEDLGFRKSYRLRAHARGQEDRSERGAHKKRARTTSIRNLRLNYIYRPGDDFFVYNESKTIGLDGRPGRVNRSLIAKLTFSVDFS